MKTIKDIDVKDKTILLRADYNAPLKDGKITDNLRIRASLPTLQYLKDHGAKKIIIISHLGRPESEKDTRFSLKPVSDELNKLFIQNEFLPSLNPIKIAEKSEKLPKGGILLLENLRFSKKEKQNDADFIKEIIDASKADIYVQDGFAVIHRAHASTDAVKNFLPVYAGLLLEKEIISLKSVLGNPNHPVLLIIGGSKVEDKQPLINKFVNLADHILVGGKIAADGYKSKNSKIIVASDFDEDAAGNKYDIGPVSTAEFAKYIENAKTIIWNGVMGKVEDPAYATSSSILADLVGKNKEAVSIICGGDTTGFVENYAASHEDLNYTLISTGGGASLEFLLGKDLPGLKAIKE